MAELPAMYVPYALYTVNSWFSIVQWGRKPMESNDVTGPQKKTPKHNKTL